MADFNPFSAFWLSLFVLVALFYLLRPVVFLVWTRRFDLESEIGHGLMAIGMAAMLAPPEFQTSTLLTWGILLFVFVTCWFVARLLARRPLLASRHTTSDPSLRRADTIHIFTAIGMVWMFLEMGNMALSMALPVASLNCAFFVAFIFLLLSYARDVSRDLQSARVDWFKLGADLAHVLMNGVMSWMFIEMLTMTIRMQA